MTTDFKMSDIRTDSDLQNRETLDPETIDEYAEAMEAGDEFPPIEVFFDGDIHWLADGFHRVFAARKLRRETIRANVTEGSRREAILHSTGVNAVHGLRRTNGDKRRAVSRLLQDPEWSQWSDREIARQCRVSNGFVSNLRRFYAPDPALSVYGTQIDRRTVSRGGSKYEMGTANIGKKAELSVNRLQIDETELSVYGTQIDEPEPSVNRLQIAPIRSMEESVLCPKCDQAIFPAQDIRPDGSIVCDACKKRFSSYEALLMAVQKVIADSRIGIVLGIGLSMGELGELSRMCKVNERMYEKIGWPGLAKLFQQLYEQAEKARVS